MSYVLARAVALLLNSERGYKYGCTKIRVYGWKGKSWALMNT